MALDRAKAKARELKQHTLTVYFAARDPRTPFVVRLLAVCIAAYALSPIDLIPDVIPILGYLDDILIVPLGLVLMIRLLPPEVMADARERAQQTTVKPTSVAAAVFMVAVWILGGAYVVHLVMGGWGR